MFTGIVEEAGKVVRVVPGRGWLKLVVETKRCGRGLKKGDSLAVNGCCLTVVGLVGPGRGRRLLEFDLLQETWRRTNFRELSPGRRVNLERPLRVEGGLDGHFVTGHIDGCGTVTRLERHGQDHLLEVTAPPEVMRYVVFKGSIALDGISFTVAAVRPRGFRVWIIPHTWEVTALPERRVGSLVNLEADILGKYVEKLLRRTPTRSAPPLS
jgi:riboflavin synthase